MNCRSCLVCSAPLEHKRSDAKYCSSLCSSRSPSRKAYRKLPHLSVQREYTKTPTGKLMMTYHNMRGRATGIQTKKAHLYKGKSLLSREDFYAWSRSNAACPHPSIA